MSYSDLKRSSLTLGQVCIGIGVLTRTRTRTRTRAASADLAGESVRLVQ